MKRVFSSILAASMMLIGTAAIAQPSLGIGYLNSTDKVKSGSTTKTTNLNGFYVGGSYNINLAGSFGVARDCTMVLLPRVMRTAISASTLMLTLQNTIFPSL